jgi:hypothetical protein
LRRGALGQGYGGLQVSYWVRGESFLYGTDHSAGEDFGTHPAMGLL